MLSNRRTTWLFFFLILCAWSAGCSRTQLQSDGMSDPLVASNKPVEGTAISAITKRHRTEYPSPPTVPKGLWNVARKSNPIKLLSPEEMSQSFIWSSQKHSSPVESDESLKAGKNYQWLQGKVDHVSARYVLLRFAEESTNEPWGGKVCLDQHPSLRTVQTDDLVYVEGQMRTEDGQPMIGHWCPYPRYRIEKLLILRRED